MLAKNDKIFFVFIFGVLMFSLQIYSSWNMGLTVDEGTHMRYGLQILKGDSSRFDDSKMPITALNALPTRMTELLSGIFPDWEPPSVLFYYGAARIPTMLFSLIILFFIYRQTLELFGVDAAILASFLFSVCPNIIAHSRLITNDVYAMGAIFLSVYALDIYIRKRSLKRLLLLSCATAFALISKFTSVFLYPLIVLILILRYYGTICAAFRKRKFFNPAKFAKAVILHFAIFAAANLIFLNAAYFFNGTFKAINSYELKSDEFKRLAGIPVLSSLPLPLPAPMLEGMDWVAYNQKTGETFGNIYMLGMTAPRGQGFRAYYLIVWLFKIPLGMQFLFYISLGYYFYVRRRCIFSILNDRIFLLLLLPAAFFFFLLSFFLKAQLGVRYFLICLPFIIIFSSGIAVRISEKYQIMRKIIVFFALWVLFSGLSYYPHYISYFNELSYDRKNNWKILADSNLDWGEKHNYLLEYAAKYPEIIYNPEQPVKGHIVVDANMLASVTASPEKFAWLRAHEPESHIAYSYIVYHIR